MREGAEASTGERSVFPAGATPAKRFLTSFGRAEWRLGLARGSVVQEPDRLSWELQDVVE